MLLRYLALNNNPQPLGKRSPIGARSLLCSGLESGRYAEVDRGVHLFGALRFSSHISPRLVVAENFTTSVDKLQVVIQNERINSTKESL